MRVLICGGRDFNDMESLAKTMDDLHSRSPISVVISGKAAGADTLGERWAACNKIPVEAFPANWSLYGRSAGPIRNKQMLNEGKPDLVVAFPGGTGTKDMVTRARGAGVPVVEIPRRPENTPSKLQRTYFAQRLPGFANEAPGE